MTQGPKIETGPHCWEVAEKIVLALLFLCRVFYMPLQGYRRYKAVKSMVSLTRLDLREMLHEIKTSISSLMREDNYSPNAK